MAAEKAKRVGFKRSEVFQIGNMILAATEKTVVGLAWRHGHSDASIAEAASIKLSRSITADDVVRIRQQTVGKLAVEDSSAKAQVAVLTRSILEMSSRMKLLEDRVRALEDEITAPPEPQPIEDAPREATVEYTGTTYRGNGNGRSHHHKR